MAVTRKIYLLALLLLSIFWAGFSCAEKELKGEHNPVFNLSLKNFKSALEEYEAFLYTCEKDERPVPASIITPLGLTKDQLRTALLTLYIRAQVKCYSGSDNKFFVAAAIHREVANHYGLSAGDASTYDANLFYSGQWRELEREIKYLLIDESIRLKLEATEELKVPFSLIDTFDDINAKQRDD